MTADEWMDVIGKINPACVKEAGQWKKMGKKDLFLRRILPMAACVAVLAAGGVTSVRLLGARQDTADMAAAVTSDAENAPEEMIAGTEETADAAAAEECFEETQETTCVDSDGGTVFLNEVTQMQVLCADFGYASTEELAADGFADYYGVAVEPEELPEDLALAGACEAGMDQSAATFGSDTFCGKIYYNEENHVVSDNNTLIYRNADGSRTLEISARTVDCGTMVSFDEEEKTQTSDINGTSVTLGQLAGTEAYTAIFTKAGVTFTVETENLTEEEFLAVVGQLCD